MTRYFFDAADGEKDTDDDGVDLGGDDQAVREAIRYAGSMLHDQPDMLAARGEFSVAVRRDGASPLATIRVALSRHRPAWPGV